MPTADIDRLRAVKTLAQLIAYLRDELDWPIGSDPVEDVTFTYDPAELGFNANATVHIKEVKQLRPLHANQPWGVFWVNFEKKRLPVVMLRRALGHLVVKKRASAGRADQKAWRMNDLLFISAYGEDHDRAITFAHFSQDQGASGELPVLKVLGWDDADTVLKLAGVRRALTEKLRWPGEPADVAEWRRQWAEAFTLRHREVITSTELLVDELARLATNIRDAVLFVVSRETEKGPWRRLLAAFQATLIRELTQESFADVIAQTISYGLLTARFTGAGPITLQNLVDLVPRTNPFLRELLEYFLSSAGRRGLFDVDEVGIDEVVSLLNRSNAEAIKNDFGNKTSGEDPVIHFYEHFLSAYNKELKIQRGVFYTPQSVVSYIVRSVHALLQTEFGLEDGLADTATWGEMLKRHSGLKLPPLTDEPGETRTISPDEPFVQILDPATGTATFIIEVIDVIHRTLEAKWQKERLSDAQQRAAWNTYVPQHLLPRIHAYELMMAPYAIAHMKIGLKLAETGYDFATEERARVYLTNALEPWLKQLPLIGLDALAHEAAAVNEIKRSKRFTVVVGNPPYSLVSANMEPTHRVLVERYKRIEGTPLKERGALQLEKILNDDYVKFIAKSQDALTSAGAGLMGVITNHAYLDNPTMRGLRHSFLASFAQGYFFDLGGSAKKVSEDVDENVFDIQQGVAIAIAVKGGLASGAGSRHAKLVGVRENKYRILSGSSVEGTGWAELSPSAPYYLFVPTDYELRTDYERFVSLSDVFPLHSIGCFTSKDHFVISRDPRQLVVNAKTFRDSKLADRELCKSLDINPKEAWNVQRSRQQLAGLSDADLAKQVVHFVHRPFDLKYIFFHRSLVWSLAYPVNRNLVKPRNLALVTSRQLATPPWNHVFCASAIVEMFLMSNKTKEGNHVFPLHVLPDDENEQRSFGNEEGHPNLSPAFLAQLSRALALPPVGPHGLPADLTSEDIFNYVYAVFHCPGYRNLYVEFLKIDFPRLPLPGSLELFRALARLGSELTSLHLMESPRLAKPITEFIGAPNPAVEKVSWSKGTVWVDRAQTAGFKGVREDVWNFHIGAYQVCEKWLKDRKGRTLSKGDLAHYQKVVVALAETIRLMEEIDKVIGAHGGWPGAFGTAGGLESVAIQPILQPDEVVEESEPKPRQTKSAPLPMFDGGESDKDSAPDSIDDIDRSDVMAAIRDLLDGPEGAVGIDREEAIRRLAKELGFKRVGSRIKEVLHGDLIAGARRQILETVGGRVRRLTRSIADYDREFLKEQFVASLEGKAWWERDDAIRDFARWLGFRRTGSAIEDTARSLINGLIRTGRLEAEGTQIRKAGR